MLRVDTVNGMFSPKENIFSVASVVELFTSSSDVITEVHQIKGNARFIKYRKMLAVEMHSQKAKYYKGLKGL